MLKFIFIIGAFQSLYFAIILLSKKQNHLPNRFMGIWLLILCLGFVDSFVAASEIFRTFPHLSGLFSGTPLVYGPLFWLYVYYLLNPDKRWGIQQWIHFLPVLLYYIYGLATFFTGSGEEKILIMDRIAQGDPPTYIFAWGIVKAFHGFAYMAFVLFYLQQFKRQALNRFSNPDQIRIKWLTILTICLLIIYSLAILNNGLVYIFQLNLEVVLGLCSMALILAGGYFALQQQALFKPEEWKRVQPQSPEKKNYNLHELKARVDAYMQKEKPYLDPDFNLLQFSIGVELSSKDLSRVLNQGFGVNFFTFVNQYRVEEVVRQMQDPANDHLTLLGIAFQCGFNSKTTFNTVFKREMGQTPSQYKRSVTV